MKPAQRFFAVFGYFIFSIIIAIGASEIISFVGLSIHHAFHSTRPTNQQALEADVFASVFSHCRGLAGDDCTPNWVNLMSASSAYDIHEWAEEYWKEERARYQKDLNQPETYVPFRVWGVREWHGKYVNVDAGPGDHWLQRVTTNEIDPQCIEQTILDVYVFGGSTAWGTGSPDWMTIPSYLSKKLNAGSDKCFRVHNFGVGGYATNQEVILLVELLKDRKNPDIVVFYDGANDAYVGGFSPGLASAHTNLVQIKQKLESKPGGGETAFTCLSHFVQKSYSFRALKGLLERGRGDFRMATVDDDDEIVIASLTEEELAVRAKETLDNYEQNIRLVKALGQAYGFEAYFFWQPVLPYDNKLLVPFEAAMMDNPSLIDIAGMNEAVGEQTLRAIRSVYEEAERRSLTSKDFVFLGRVFGQCDEPIYIDWHHVAPRGNEIIAQAIEQEILGTP